MKKLLWDFPEEIQSTIVALSVDRHGELIGEMSSPHSSIFTFDQGSHTYPRYVVAKGIRLDSSMTMEDKRKYLQRALYEVNNAHVVCHHPSIQRFFDVEIVLGIPFLLSRKRDATLRDVIAEGALSETEAISVAIQIVHALTYCARKGLICHQDLKPENIFVDFIADRFRVPPDYPLRCLALVADFELANAYFVLGHPYGSRPYMAPEQYQRISEDAALADFSRVDVFALGVKLFEMLTGGVHPVGEHTSLIWPNPAEGKSRKWLRESPWKRWIERGAQLDSNGASKLHPEMVRIIEGCLESDAGKRLSKDQLEARLLGRLNDVDSHAYESLSLMLVNFDQLTREGEEGGWPYYSDRLQQLNDAFSDRT